MATNYKIYKDKNTNRLIVDFGSDVDAFLAAPPKNHPLLESKRKELDCESIEFHVKLL